MAAGETCVLLGPSGCGKTTTLRMINRLVAPTSGKVFIAGRDTDAVDPVELRRTIGYVIQQIGLFPNMTVAQNIGVVPRLLKWDAARMRRRAEELLAMLALEPAEFMDRYPNELSGGQAQRVGVARALAADPPVLLMDEPFGAVDPVNREVIQDEFLRMQKSLRKTVLFVSHDIDEAVKMADRIAIFRAGQLEQYAAPDELLARPANEFVAGFVGSDRTLKRLRRIRVAEVMVAGETQRPVARPRCARPTICGAWPRSFSSTASSRLRASTPTAARSGASHATPSRPRLGRAMMPREASERPPFRSARCCLTWCSAPSRSRSCGRSSPPVCGPTSCGIARTSCT